MLRFLTAGESHGPALTVIVEGLPAGLKVDEEAINTALARRQMGYGRGGRMQIEKDRAKVLSGIRFGLTLGSPVSLLIENRDWENWREDMSVFGPPRSDKAVNRPRPGHADLAGVWKYGFADARPVLERASARNTAARVAAGAVAGCLLDALGINTASHVRGIGPAVLPADKNPGVAEIAARAYHSDVFCVCPETAAAMRGVIDQAKAAGDSVGGVVEVVVERLIPGLGSYVHWDRRLDGLLAQAVMSIPAFKAVELGEGIVAACNFGSRVHDGIVPENGLAARAGNNAGGLEGGMSNGQPLVVRGFMKPIPTLTTALPSLDFTTGEATAAAAERSDTCAAPAAAIVAEAMVKWVLAAAVVEKFAADNMCDLLVSVAQYKDRLRQGGCGPCDW